VAALALTVTSYCTVINRPWLAAVLTAAPMAGVGILMYMQFPQALRA